MTVTEGSSYGTPTSTSAVGSAGNKSPARPKTTEEVARGVAVPSRASMALKPAEGVAGVPTA